MKLVKHYHIRSISNESRRFNEKILTFTAGKNVKDIQAFVNNSQEIAKKGLFVALQQ